MLTGFFAEYTQFLFKLLRCVRISSFEETSVSLPMKMVMMVIDDGDDGDDDDDKADGDDDRASEEDLRGAKVLPMNPRIREEQQTRQVARLKVLHRHAVDPGEETATRTQPDETQAEDPAEPQLGPKSPCEEELPYLEPFREAVQFPGTVSVTYYSCEDCETEGFCTSDTSFSNYDAACGDARRPEETYAEAARHIFAHTHMTAFEPAMRLDLVSDLDRSMGHEKYHRDAANMLIVGLCFQPLPTYNHPLVCDLSPDTLWTLSSFGAKAERSMDRAKYHRHAANMLIKLLQRASAKTIAQLSAGRTALMLREQQTKRRVNKIKSKTYRRIHRKSEAKDREVLLQRLEHENPELAQQLKQEKPRSY
ncbi:hypothetical protein AK812_SmicGene22992 [Symbiodinium microadriaticum]|uniref:Uncharacterized protein n=1 Tax=Symbiodinium microadriaticum TaxID=2951 RepID=A0A1Q9DIB0_SYMMI|nr:hypothetical protein AK812_SmicGene22992 [Symbiodinium microadriaticum]